MKLSMQIFADWLKEYNPQMDVKANLFEIETVRLFSGNLTLNANTLYIGRLGDFFKNTGSQVICVHNNDMLILQTEELEEVLDRALDAMEYYSSWDNRMMHLLASDAMLQDLVDASEGKIVEPIFLVDASQRLLAYSKWFGLGTVDEAWDELLEHGSMKMDTLVELNAKHPEIIDKPGLQRNENSVELFPYGSYINNFYFQKNWSGTLVLIEKDGEVGMGELDRLQLLCGYLGHWFENHLEEQQNVVIDHMIRNAISSVDFENEQLNRLLLLQGWKTTDELVLIKLDAPFQPFIINSHLCRTLNHYFKDVFAVSFQLSVCLLCNLREKSLEQYVKELEPMLLNSKYCGVYGRSFTMADSYYDHYTYVSVGSEYCEKQVGQVYAAGAYDLQYIFSQMQNGVVKDFCHPALQTLRDYDDSHHTELYQTLQVYLEQERSPVAAAASLGLHRNSFAYRLKKLEEILHLDLDNPMLRLHLLISYQIMR